MEIICAVEAVYGDGTFYVAPQMFTQLYTLHAMHHNEMLPLVYALLPTKDGATYSRMLTCLDTKLARMGLVLNPQIVVLDFKNAAHNAWTTARPNNPPHIRGCFFHFSQCLWRKLQMLHLQQLYNTEMAFQSWAKMILALPLFPTYEVENEFQHLVQIAPVGIAPTLPQFLNYIQTFWIDDICHCHFQNPSMEPLCDIG